MSARQICRCGVAVALLAVASYISVPFGPVPFTLQTLVLALLPVALGGRDALVAVALYLLLGAAGLPVFSGMSGGAGHLLGPTGGYLWGFFVGTALDALILRLRAIPEPVRGVVGAALLLLTSYVCGTIQLMTVMGMGVEAALAAAVIPFVIPDVVKMLVGVSVGYRVRRALSVSAMDLV